MFYDAADSDGLMNHPLLKIDHMDSFLASDLIKDLQKVKCFVVWEPFEVASKKIMIYHQKMVELLS